MENSSKHHDEQPSNNLTKREWYAGLALAGTLAKIGGIHYLDKPEETKRLTDESFQFADAMIESSKK
jgi:hypothetical protein